MKKTSFRRVTELFVFPAVLLLYPLTQIHQGMDVTDTMYSLVNFQMFGKGGSDWIIATYLANVTGHFLQYLPFGDTLMGMNFYTGLFISAMALLGYFFLKGKMPAVLAFAGEIIAIGLCWIPTPSLYNYLTYFLFLTGSVFLYRGLIWEKKKWLFLAGVCLGLNVMVRLPNILECGLIAAVFYYGILKKKEAKEVWQQTGVCVAGFLAGFLVPFLVICVQYGPAAYLEMITGLSSYQSTDATYSPFTMITSVLGAYGTSLKWILLIAVAVGAGILFFRLVPQRFEKAKQIVFAICIPVLLRLLWGKGMFDLNYRFYWSVFQWTMVLLYAAIGLCIWAMTARGIFHRDRLLALLVLLIIAITPIGSNNETYPNMNNLFLAAPVTFWFGYRLCLSLKDRSFLFPVRAMAVALTAVLFVQSMGFGLTSVFRDNIYGGKRDTKVENCAPLAGMRTDKATALEIQGVVDYFNSVKKEEPSLDQDAVITIGNCPGMCYILNMQPALSTPWADLDTYSAAQMKEDMASIQKQASERPFVVMKMEDESEWNENQRQKHELILDYIEKNGFETVCESGSYRIYGVKG